MGAITSMIGGFLSGTVIKLVIQPMPAFTKCIDKLDGLAPSFAYAILMGFVFSKIFPSEQRNKSV